MPWFIEDPKVNPGKMSKWWLDHWLHVIDFANVICRFLQ